MDKYLSIFVRIFYYILVVSFYIKYNLNYGQVLNTECIKESNVYFNIVLLGIPLTYFILSLFFYYNYLSYWDIPRYIKELFFIDLKYTKFYPFILLIDINIFMFLFNFTYYITTNSDIFSDIITCNPDIISAYLFNFNGFFFFAVYYHCVKFYNNYNYLMVEEKPIIETEMSLV